MLTITLFYGLSVKCIQNCFLQSSTIIFRLTWLSLRQVVFISRNTIFHSNPIGWFAVHSNIEQSEFQSVYVLWFWFSFFISLWKILSRILAPTHLSILYACMHACIFAYTYICGYLYFYKNTDMCMYMFVSVSVSAILSVILALTPSLLYSILHYSLCHYCVKYFDVHLWQVNYWPW